MKLYIISNRLPVKAVHRDGAYLFTRSEGGLATGLHALHTRYEKHWIGWPGVDVETDEDRRSIREELAKMNFHPIFLTPEQIANYYEGYSNSTIWPLCHYFFAFTRYRKDFWEAYRKVNALFCEEILRRIEPDDIVWVQDYQLMLLPGLLREHRPALRIGYFHHIPFPSYELFRILPERAEILRGVLGADLVAFHTHDYMRHFIGTAERVLHIDFRLDETQIGNRCVRVDALPMGIDYAAFHGISSNAGAQPLIAKTREQFGDRKLILSVDRLDYSKGILHRLRGFGSFLERYPEYRGQATLAMVIVPSRDRVNSYADLKTEIDKEIGAINGRYSTMEWTPVRYFYHGFSFEELAAMYYVADVALVTPLRDGMNLVAKEYVAVKNDNPGVLILSEMAGAAVELADALPINPNDTEQIAAAIHRALTMPVEEQLRRIERMQAVVSTQTVNKWAADFMKELADVCRHNEAVRRKRLTSETVAAEISGHTVVRNDGCCCSITTVRSLRSVPVPKRPYPRTGSANCSVRWERMPRTAWSFAAAATPARSKSGSADCPYRSLPSTVPSTRIAAHGVATSAPPRGIRSCRRCSNTSHGRRPARASNANRRRWHGITAKPTAGWDSCAHSNWSTRSCRCAHA